MRARTYSLLLVIPLLAVAGAALAAMFYIQPNFGGDLTRIGGYANRDFGWNAPQRATVDNSVVLARDLSADSRRYDVVVLGDSFSHFEPPKLNRWQQFFATATGLSVVTYHFDNVWLDDYLDSAAFKSHPPRLLVMEFVERNIETFVKAGHLAECDGPVADARPAAWALPDNPVPVRPLIRPTGIASLEQAMNFLRINAKDAHKVDRFQLSTGHLFSNRDSSELLALRDDQLKYGLRSADIRRLGCYLRARQQRAEANGVTRFVLMVPPDKTSAYCPYLRDIGSNRCDSLVDRLFVPGLHHLGLNHVIAAALAAGAQDVYLPNDTHWGYRGSKLAATALRNWLTQSAGAAPQAVR